MRLELRPQQKKINLTNEFNIWLHHVGEMEHSNQSPRTKTTRQSLQTYSCNMYRSVKFAVGSPKEIVFSELKIISPVQTLPHVTELQFDNFNSCLSFWAYDCMPSDLIVSLKRPPYIMYIAYQKHKTHLRCSLKTTSTMPQPRHVRSNTTGNLASNYASEAQGRVQDATWFLLGAHAAIHALIQMPQLQCK